MASHRAMCEIRLLQSEDGGGKIVYVSSVISFKPIGLTDADRVWGKTTDPSVERLSPHHELP